MPGAAGEAPEARADQANEGPANSDDDHSDKRLLAAQTFSNSANMSNRSVDEAKSSLGSKGDTSAEAKRAKRK